MAVTARSVSSGPKIGPVATAQATSSLGGGATVTQTSNTKAEKTLVKKSEALKDAYKAGRTRAVYQALQLFLETKEACYGIQGLTSDEKDCLLSLEFAAHTAPSIVGWFQNGRLTRLQDTAAALSKVGAPWAAETLLSAFSVLPPDMQVATIAGNSDAWSDFTPDAALQAALEDLDDAYCRNEYQLAPQSSLNRVIVEFAMSQRIE